MEIRFKDAKLECRENGELKVGGYINVTERDSEILFSQKREKWFVEKMQKGVFQRALEKASEVPLLFQHDWEKRLASTLDQSLKLKEDNIGLRFDATINNPEVYDLVQKGELNSCSFGFIVRNQSFEPVDSKLEKRYVTDIELLEVSLVNKPAYVGSLAEVRAYEEALAEEENKKKKKDDKDTSEENPNGKKDEKEVKDKEQDKEKPVGTKDNKKDDKPKDDKKEKSDNNKGKSDKISQDNFKKESEDKSDKKDESEDKKKKDEKREDDNSISYKDEELKRAISEILDKVIEEKNLALTRKESEEQFLQESIQKEKQFSNEIVSELEGEAMRCSGDVVQLRLDLLKLKNVKKEYK